MSSVRHDRAHSHSGAGEARSDSSCRDWNRAGGIPRFLSIVIPAKDESASLPDLVAEITRAFRPLTARRRDVGNPLDGFEILVVDDGSTDDSVAVLERLQRAYTELRPTALARSAGQSAATLAGFHAARGAWVAILDADLQNDPADLARLWDALPGHDAGLGWRVKRRDVWTKRWISKVANTLRRWVLGDDARDTGCAVRIFPRAVAVQFPMFHGAHRFYGAFLRRAGCEIVQIPCNHRPRPHGRSHYNLWNRSTRVVIDLAGVAWLMRRPVRYELRSMDGDAPAPMAAAAGATSSAASRAVAASPEA